MLTITPNMMMNLPRAEQAVAANQTMRAANINPHHLTNESKAARPNLAIKNIRANPDKWYYCLHMNSTTTISTYPMTCRIRRENGNLFHQNLFTNKLRRNGNPLHRNLHGNPMDWSLFKRSIRSSMA